MSLIPINSLKKTKTTENPITIVEKDFLYLKKNNESTEIYKKFESSLALYLTKIKNQPASICNLLLTKDSIYLGLLLNANPNILGNYIVLNNKISAVTLNTSNLEIDIKTGELSEADNVVYIVYYQFIRALGEIYFNEIERNSELNNLLIEYYNYVLMKTLKLPMLNDKQIELLKFIVGVMFYKHFYKYNDILAIEKCESLISKEYYQEFKPTIKNSNISKYQDIKDIIKLINEFKISFDPPNQMMYQLLVSIKTMGVLLLTSDIQNLIAVAITSQYPCEYYSNLFINRPSQSKIESIISQFYPKVEFGKL